MSDVVPAVRAWLEALGVDPDAENDPVVREAIAANCVWRVVGADDAPCVLAACYDRSARAFRPAIGFAPGEWLRLPTRHGTIDAAFADAVRALGSHSDDVARATHATPV